MLKTNVNTYIHSLISLAVFTWAHDQRHECGSRYLYGGTDKILCMRGREEERERERMEVGMTTPYPSYTDYTTVQS